MNDKNLQIVEASNTIDECKDWNVDWWIYQGHIINGLISKYEIKK